jgi:hypothetical protein
MSTTKENSNTTAERNQTGNRNQENQQNDMLEGKDAGEIMDKVREGASHSHDGKTATAERHANEGDQRTDEERAEAILEGAHKGGVNSHKNDPE